MSRPIEGAVVVITGASSGIGRATALEFARRGARLVVAARRPEPLQVLVRKCEALGGQAIAVPTDVTSAAAVNALAEAAVKTFGRLDIWVNNAAVSVYGRFEEVPLELERQVIETNVFGYLYGARAALRHFRRQSSGVLINISSMLGKMAAPYLSSYTLSKHAVRALGMSLREELALDGAHQIDVCTIMPATIDTPFFEHAANLTGRALKPLPPVYPPQQVAAAIVGCAERPQRELFVGSVGRAINVQQALAPSLTERTMARMVDSQHFKDEPAPPTSGNLLRPMAAGSSVEGGWHGQERQATRRLVSLGLALLAPAAVLWSRRRRQRERALPALLERAVGR